MPDQLQVERGFSPNTIERLKARGHSVEVISHQGEVAAIVVNHGWLEGAADPRESELAREGQARVRSKRLPNNGAGPIK
jgi:gamma-glutamyltranspeptidase/glutathione hydrolase